MNHNTKVMQLQMTKVYDAKVVTLMKHPSFLACAIGVGVAAVFATFLVHVSFTTYSETLFVESLKNATVFNTTISISDGIVESQTNLGSSHSVYINGKVEHFSPATLPEISTTLSANMGLEGKTIPECCCSFCELEEANIDTIHPLLNKIVETPFFSHFKIDLCSSCELWEDTPLCIMRDCSVCECEDPPEWSQNVDEFPPTGPDPSCEGNIDDDIFTGVDTSVLDGWNDSDELSMFEESDLAFLRDNGATAPERTNRAQVVDLLKNPEGYTGYSGPSAEKVWSAIHLQNCYQNPTSGTSTSGDNNDSYCSLSSEQRLYNRFISGLHSSISLHIAHSYCLELDPENTWECRVWGPNDSIAHDRVLSHRDRVENLYVAFSLLLRAVVKAESAIATAVPASDPILQESLVYWQESLLPELLALPQKSPVTFDESQLLDFNGSDTLLQEKRIELQRRFQELQSIMQCVGCDRCKLWGTLQTLGVGTALRILFHDPHASIQLSRQEAVALVNTLERLSSSLVFAREFRLRHEKTKIFDQGKEVSCGI